MIVFQITAKLIFAAFIIRISTPYLHFNYISFPHIVNNQICALLIPRSGFHIIVSHSINDWLQIKHKVPSSVFLKKFFISVSKNIIEMYHKLFKYLFHIQKTILNKLIFVTKREPVHFAVLHLRECEEIIVKPCFENSVCNLHGSMIHLYKSSF